MRCHAQLYECDICGAIPPTYQAIGVHKAKQHGFRRVEREKFANVTCRYCLINFETRTRMLNHLADKSPKCGAHYRALPSLSPDIIAMAESEEAARIRAARRRGQGTHKIGCLCRRAYGPFLPEVVAQGVGKNHPLGAGRRKHC